MILGVAALVAWAAFEVAFRSPGEASSWRGEATDRASTPLLIVAFAVAGIVPILLRQSSIGSIGDAAWAGIALAIAGLVVRGWGMRTLGGAYSRTMRTTAGQSLITAGPYRFVRNPGYLGSIAVWVGATLAFHNWIAAALVAVIMLSAYGWRISVEEKMLAARFGDEYRSYAARTSRLIPGVY